MYLLGNYDLLSDIYGACDVSRRFWLGQLIPLESFKQQLHISGSPLRTGIGRDNASRCGRFGLAVSQGPQWVDPEPSPRLTLAYSLDHRRVTHAPIQIHVLHPPPFANNRKGFSLMGFPYQFCSECRD